MPKMRRFTVARMALAASVLAFIVSCGGGGGGGGNGTNSTPIAKAGSDKNVLVGWKVNLSGSGSSNASTYSWSLTPPAGSAATLSSRTVSSPTFTADKAGSYTISLVVSNGSVSSSPDPVNITAVSPRAVPDSGQTTFYAAGDDSTYLSSAPSYTDHSDGTITDNVTGLMWQKCSAWLTGSLCTGGTLTAYNWYEANGTGDLSTNPTGTNACGIPFAGYNDWRLPTDFELMTIADYGTSGARAINGTYFPGTTLAYYWSSSESVVNSTSAWSVEFNSGGGSVMTGPKGSTTPYGMVRCVRGERSAPVLTADNTNGTITDNVAGLMWQKQDDGLKKNWAGALSYCQGLTFAGHSDWRVPNIKELRSIVDTTKYGPAVNTAYFLNTKTSNYWSSTSVVSNPTTFAWTVSFNSGAVNDTVNKTFQYYYVRCVRSLP